MKCSVAYEISLTIPGLKNTRSVVFVGKKAARDFQRKHVGAKLRAVELCDGEIRRSGKHSY